MKVNTECKYGYKLSYTKPPQKEVTDRFLTKTYKEAERYKAFFLRTPKWGCLEEPIPKRVQWQIIPIRKWEVKQGIWRSVPWIIKKKVRRYNKWILI